MEKQGIMFNYDCDNFYHTRKEIIDTVDTAYLESFIDQYKGTQVTDFVFNLYALLSSFPSKIFTSYADRYHVKKELGRSVDFSDSCCYSAHVLWEVKKLDMYQIWINRCRKNGIRPWLSFRMNDVHCLMELPIDYVIPPEKYNHFYDHTRTRHRRHLDGYDRCYDYSIEIVRNRMLSYIEEALTRYDVYGIELDFQRELPCLRIGHEDSDRSVMTAFIGQVKALTDRIAQKVGHPIQISVRCHPNPVSCREMGFDIVEWAKQGYINMFIAAPYFESADTDMPIALWKQILEPYGTKVAGSLEIGINPYKGGPRDHNSISTAMGIASSILSQNPDQLYLYNYFDSADRMMLGDRRFFNFDDDKLKTAEGMYRFLCHAGSMETIQVCPRKTLITYTDSGPFWRHIDFQLPCLVDDIEHARYLRFVTGAIPNEQNADLILGIREDFHPESCEVFVNCERLTYIGEVPHTAPVLTDSKLHAFRLPDSVKPSNVMIAEFLLLDPAKPFTIDYADISIR